MATTNYGGKGNPLNEILYSKDQYDAGNKEWAKQNAQKYYAQLDANEAATVKGLDAQGLRDYIASKNAPAQQAPTTQAIAAPAQQSSQSYIDALNEARKQQTLAQLGKSRDAALSNINAEKATIQPRYYDARNQTAASSQQNARNFAEYMAARGGTASGANAQAELTRGMALQGNLGSLRRQETAAFDDIGRRTTDLENAYQSDIASAYAGIEADRMQAMLNDYYQQQQRELQIAQLTGILNGQKTLDGQQFDWGKAVDTAGLTGYFNGTPTASMQNQLFNQNLSTQQFNEGVRQFDQNFNRSVFENDREYDLAKQKFEEDMRQFGVNTALQRASQAVSAARESRLSSGGGSSGSSSSSNTYTGGVVSDLTRPRTASTMETWLINNIPGGNNVAGPPPPNQIAWIETQILNNPNLSDADITKLFNRFGIPLPE
ncbi:hypothetical protein B1748_23495 [Paenibacillus sp. MY03]|uniref:hypothetical protein n=1 Tax=Paenibacillus sp. MY03 TaxID=302980 RepID=UPI000B3D0273|nr:hypothetical protein [Paenibacillus sp. MY03]OUS72976.1 hypothetical protein B1748_23495 [Paenibacillus sp. MY03]